MNSPHRLCTSEEYLTLESDAPARSEYVNGHMYAMAGAETTHELLVANLIAGVHAGMRGRPCRVYGSNLQIKVRASGMYTYPDVSAMCGRPEFEPTRPQTLVNPSVVVEVLSPSTEAYDRGAKFAHYQLMPTLAEYVMVAQDHMRIERYLRSGASWQFDQCTRPDEMVSLPSIAGVLRVGDVYAGVEFHDEPPSRMPRLMREADARAWAARA